MSLEDDLAGRPGVVRISTEARQAAAVDIAYRDGFFYIGRGDSHHVFEEDNLYAALDEARDHPLA